MKANQREWNVFHLNHFICVSEKVKEKQLKQFNFSLERKKNEYIRGFDQIKFLSSKSPASPSGLIMKSQSSVSEREMDE